ncbi:MAG: S24 family peptidase [Candidatus Kapaibacteriota bacterium]
MDEQERRRLIKQIEREIYFAHLRGQLPPNFDKTLRILETMGIDPDDLLDNAFYKFDLLSILSESGSCEPIASQSIDFAQKIVYEVGTGKEIESLSRSGFFSYTVVGDSMIGVGIEDGDIVLVRQEPFEDGAVYVVKVEDSFFIKRVQTTNKGYCLISENPKYEPVEIKIKDNIEFNIIGKVKYILKRIA